MNKPKLRLVVDNTKKQLMFQQTMIRMLSGIIIGSVILNILLMIKLVIR